MLVSVQSFGSVWRNSFGKDPADPRRFVRAAYRNTTGVRVNGKLVTRPRIKGHARFNGVGGFNANFLHRMVNQVFDCEEPCIWQGEFKVLFKRLVRHAPRPDFYLVAATHDQVGRFTVGGFDWKSGEVLVLSFSEDGDQQELLLLMPAHSWFRTSLGTFAIEPKEATPCRGELRLVQLT